MIQKWLGVGLKLQRRRASKVAFGVLLAAGLVPAAHADWVSGTVTEIQYYASGSGAAPDPGDKILVIGTFNTGCASPHTFLLTRADSYFKEVYAAILSAKLTATPIKYLHIYCTSEGYSRGNAYALYQ